jgi:hypothetical protein
MLAVASACASQEYTSQRTMEDPNWKNGVRQTPVTPDEISKMISARSEELQKCYNRARINNDKVRAFTYKLDVPNDGSDVKVTLVGTPPTMAQKFQSTCLGDVIRQLRVPAHVGQPFQVEVPIEP